MGNIIKLNKIHKTQGYSIINKIHLISNNFISNKSLFRKELDNFKIFVKQFFRSFLIWYINNTIGKENKRGNKWHSKVN